eukprot:TRINITY_DN15190_c0_g1_i1.p1 TRINITY_DN15190_c0_g1~~TRINITY_DN15190_c0_g1_i1.p1  ORF type:complete len:282 (+),score=97.55 TRINITY_DN15190_c0_g1_i1:67-846(+)
MPDLVYATLNLCRYLAGADAVGLEAQLAAAAAAGFRFVELDMCTVGDHVEGGGGTLEAVRPLVEKHGMAVFSLVGADLSDEAATLKMCDMADALKPRWLLCFQRAEGSVRGTFEKVCSRADAGGWEAAVEPLIPGISVVSTFAAARELFKAVGRPPRLVADVYHVMQTAMKDEAACADEIAYLQICDAMKHPAEGEAAAVHTRDCRLLPGDGELDVAAFLRRFPPTGPVVVEVLSAELRRTGADEQARKQFQAAAAALA